MQKIFVNGTILTMEDEQPIVEAILVEKEYIIKAGTRQEVFQAARDNAKVIDLKGRTLMPGFIDAHGHFGNTAMAQLSFADVSCAPIGEIKTIEQMIQQLKKYAVEQEGVIVGFGYDDTLIEDERLAEALDLNRVSATRPVIVIHSSFHLVMANDAAMKAAGVDSMDFQPEGGVVRRRNGKAIGIFEEVSAIKPLLKLAYTSEAMDKLKKGIGTVCCSYLQKGITTICEGAGSNEQAEMIKASMKRGRFAARYLICPSMTATGEMPPRVKGKHIINGPIKLLMDGSIQCYTAALSQPYASEVHGREGDEQYRGVTYMTREELRSKLETIMDSNRSFAIHCNGDGAVDDIIEALEGCRNLKRNAYKRNLLIHCQTVREEQLDKLKALNLYPSFFPAHIYAWGDRHYNTFLGKERAERLNPAGSAMKKGLIFSIHNDSPVTNVSPLELVWNVAARVTRSGRILGEEQRIPVGEALKAVTIYAAYQYKVEDILGSIAEGKHADLIALDYNPLKVPLEKLPDIRVERVWVDGELVWSDTVKKAGKSRFCRLPDSSSANYRK